MATALRASAGRSSVRPKGLGRPYTLLFLTSMAMVSLGLVMVLSASSVEAFKRYGTSFLFFRRQMAGVGIGLVAMMVAAKIDYRFLRKVARPLMWTTLALLVAVLIPAFSVTRGGSSRWLNLGPATFQPSELAKLALIVFSAHILERRGAGITDPHKLAVPVLPVAGAACLLIMLQPDLGTTIICGSCVLIVMFLAGARLAHLALVSGCALLGAVILGFSQSYRRARILSFLNPWADPLNAGYHIIQGQIAMGSGGWFGVGLGASRQKWSYVPNAHTDFIYAILGEELGLAGTISVLLLFVFTLYLGVRITRKAPDRFGFMLAGGITGWIGLQALINMGAVSGLLPITGVPLPLISFGSSSLVFTMAAIGLLLSVARRSRA